MSITFTRLVIGGGPTGSYCTRVHPLASAGFPFAPKIFPDPDCSSEPMVYTDPPVVNNARIPAPDVISITSAGVMPTGRLTVCQPGVDTIDGGSNSPVFPQTYRFVVVNKAYCGSLPSAPTNLIFVPV